MWLTGAVALSGVTLGNVAACNLNNPGTDPPEGVLSYPIALALGGKNPTTGKFDVLYVVNSNFDLKYNAGSVHAYDLNKIDARIGDEECDAVGLPPDAGVIPSDAGSDAGLDSGMDAAIADASVDASTPDAGLEGGISDASVPDASQPDAGPDASFLEEGVATPPGYENASEYGTLRGILCDDRDPAGEQCCFDDNTEFLRRNGEVLIDSYATGLEISPDLDRLYVSLRARDTLLYLDDIKSDGALSCGDEKGRCTQGTDAKDSDLDPNQSFPVQPQALTVGKLSDLVPEDSKGLTDDETFIVTVHDNGDVALLVDEGRERGPELNSVVSGVSFASTVRFKPTERLLYSSSSVADVADLYRWGVVHNNEDGKDARWLLYPSTPLRLIVAGGEDIRDLLIDEANPSRLFALMRGDVESVLFVERDAASPNEGIVTSATRVGAGPSKLTHAVLGDRRLLFVSCFDARAIFVIDEMSRDVVAVIRGLSGPFDMEVDAARERLYVADFRANVLRVVDVEGLRDSSRPPPRIVATLGRPSYGGKLE